jgi:hypothetical protein
MMDVIPAKAGIQNAKESGFRIKACPERSRMGAE